MDPLHKSSGSLLPGFPGIRSTAARAPGLGDQVVPIVLFTFTAADISIVAVISDYLFSLIRYMRTHGGDPFEDAKDLLLFSIFDPFLTAKQRRAAFQTKYRIDPIHCFPS